jgi:hypothetical protein
MRDIRKPNVCILMKFCKLFHLMSFCDVMQSLHVLGAKHTVEMKRVDNELSPCFTLIINYACTD